MRGCAVLKRCSVKIVIALFSLLGAASCAAAKPTTPEAVLLSLINEARQEADLPLLAMNSEVSKVARAHATDMIARDYFGHVSPNKSTVYTRLRKAGIEFDRAGENLAGDTSVAHAFASWMESPSHKGNVLGDFAKVGIAVVEGGSYGMMIVAVFVK